MEQANTAFARDSGAVAFGMEVYEALRSYAMARREWPKTLRKHLIEIMAFRILRDQTTDQRERNRYTGYITYRWNFWNNQAKNRRYYENTREWQRAKAKVHLEENWEEINHRKRKNNRRRTAENRKLAEQGDWRGIVQRMVTSVRSRSKKKNAWDEPFDITDEWILTEMERSEYRCPDDWLIPSIDRIDSTRGYTQENCQITCLLYNYLKREMNDVIARRMMADFLDMACFYWPQKKIAMAREQTAA